MSSFALQAPKDSNAAVEAMTKVYSKGGNDVPHQAPKIRNRIKGTRIRLSSSLRFVCGGPRMSLVVWLACGGAVGEGDDGVRAVEREDSVDEEVLMDELEGNMKENAEECAEECTEASVEEEKVSDESVWPASVVRAGTGVIVVAVFTVEIDIMLAAPSVEGFGAEGGFGGAGGVDDNTGGDGGGDGGRGTTTGVADVVVLLETIVVGRGKPGGSVDVGVGAAGVTKGIEEAVK